MKNLINQEDMERGISEMWQAVADMESSVPDQQKEMAFQKAAETEADLRQKFTYQEKLRDAAPVLLECLKKLRKWAVVKYGNGTVSDSAIHKADEVLLQFDVPLNTPPPAALLLSSSEVFDLHLFSTDLLQYINKNKFTYMEVAALINKTSADPITNAVNKKTIPKLEVAYNLCRLMGTTIEKYMRVP